MRRTFADFEKTNSGQNPESGFARVLVDDAGDLVVRESGGGETRFSASDHSHTGIAGLEQTIDLGDVTTALVIDMNGDDWQLASLTGPTYITTENGEAGRAKTVNLVLSAAANLDVTFPAFWGWKTKPALDTISLTAGQELNLKVTAIDGDLIIRAEYHIMET